MSVERLIATLGQDFELGGRDIAEVLWLITQWQTEEEETETSQPEVRKPQMEPQVNTEVKGSENQQKDEREPTVDIYAPSPEPEETGTLSIDSLPIAVPDPPTLDNTLEFVRSLRPLLKKVPVSTQSKLNINETATVESIARTDIWLPVLEPEVEPWFEVALIFDTSTSMTLWQRTLEELELCLKRYGAFRDLRTWELEVNQGKVHLRANSTSAPRSPKEILPPNGRCITLIFSDCVAPYWWDESLVPTLTEWATVMPTAIWQMFPEWMWERTALGKGYMVSLRGTRSGATSQELQAKALSLWDDEYLAGGTQLPILTIEPEAVSAWSAIVAGKPDIPMAGVVLPPPKTEEPDRHLSDEQESDQVISFPYEHGLNKGLEPIAPQGSIDANISGFDIKDNLSSEENEREQAAARIQRFRLFSSPQARRLAGLLAAAPVITLPIMRLIRASMMPGTSVLPVAEVFLGGLLEPLGDSRSTITERSRSIDLVQYDFPPEVRAELLDSLPKVDAIDVINAVSGYVAEKLGISQREFRALVLDSQSAEEKGLKAFARVTAEILGRLGYAEQAAQFARAGRTSPEPPQPQPNAEPQLQDGSFDIATLEVEEEETVIFTSDVGTLERERNQWVIRKQKQEFPGVIEELPEGVKLELVEIPPGDFTMGSPEDELERRNNEGPQHKVNVPGFLMGCYTITQAQWKAVVNNVPTIQRELNPDPSRFKGDNRPVESISWQEAVEFCARLSQYTKKQYVLPSEAQWEYACRAGTTTPFHFGETLTTDIANYHGNNTYGEGPKGEYREETTAVGHFGLTNAFGLYDMHGNVWEWCADPWHSNYERAPEDGLVWDEEQNDNRYYSYNDYLVNLLESDHTRVLRGGTWVDNPRICRCANRYDYIPDDDNYGGIGLRVVCLNN